MNYVCPELDIAPLTAIDQIQAALDQCLKRSEQIGLIGSSLGGFYATYLMERHPRRADFKAALLNPASWPARDLKNYVGELPAWHSGEVLTFRETYLDDLKTLEVGLSAAERYLLVAAKGDALLDWNEMVARYPGTQHFLIEGSDHGLSDFDQHWPTVKDFLLS